MAAGTRTLAPPSVPTATAAIPAATAAALPPLEPPGARSVFHGLRVTPHVLDSVNWPNAASSGSVVIPMITAPAARSRRTTSESEAAGVVAIPVPCDVTSPATSKLSFTATGMPSSGACSPASMRSCAATGVAHSGNLAARMSTRAPTKGMPSSSSRARCRSPLASDPSARTTRHHGSDASSDRDRMVPAKRGAPGEMSP